MPVEDLVLSLLNVGLDVIVMGMDSVVIVVFLLVRAKNNFVLLVVDAVIMDSVMRTKGNKYR